MIYIINAKETQQRVLLNDILKEYKEKGYTISKKNEDIEVTWESIISSLFNEHLFSEGEVIVVEKAQRLGKANEVVIKRLSQKTKNILVLVFEEDFSKYIDVKLLGLENVKILKSALQIPWWEKQRYIKKEFSQKGKTIDADACSLLAEMFNDDAELKSELDKLFLYLNLFNKNCITIDIVKELCEGQNERALQVLIDSICELNIKNAIKALSYLYNKEEISLVISSIYQRLRPILYFLFYKEKKTHIEIKAFVRSNYQLKKLGLLLKSGLTLQQIRKFLLALIMISITVREGKHNGWALLKRAIIKFITQAKKRGAG